MINNTKIYTKTSEGGLWEKHTRLAIGLTMIVGTILLVFASVALSFICIPMKNVPRDPADSSAGGIGTNG